MIRKKRPPSREPRAISAAASPAAISIQFKSVGHRIAYPLLGLMVGMFGLRLPAHAAGGHHAVDDAAMLDPGQCQLV